MPKSVISSPVLFVKYTNFKKMEKLTEFVTNSFVDKEVKFLPSKSSPKLEPVSPQTNHCGSRGSRSNTSAGSMDDDDERNFHNSAIGQQYPRSGSTSADDRKELLKLNNNNTIDSNHNRDREDCEKASMTVKKGNLAQSKIHLLKNYLISRPHHHAYVPYG